MLTVDTIYAGPTRACQSGSRKSEPGAAHLGSLTQGMCMSLVGFCMCARAVMGDRRWEAGRKGGVMGGGVSRSSVTASLKIQGERSADKSVKTLKYFSFSRRALHAPPSVGVANTNQTSRLCHIYVGAIYSDGEPPRRLHLQTQLDTSKQEGPSVRACEHVCAPGFTLTSETRRPVRPVVLQGARRALTCANAASRAAQ